MASNWNRVIHRCSSSLSSLRSAIAKPTLRALSFNGPATTSSPNPHSVRRFSSFIIRSRAEKLGCVQSLLPLHSAVAVARLNSCLSSSSMGCRALSQELGLSVPR